jgi:hypothetical protein
MMPAIIYCLPLYYAPWLCERAQSQNSVATWCAIACVPVLCAARFEIAFRYYALFLILAGKCKTIETAFAQSRSKRLLIYGLALPIVFADCSVLTTACLAVILTRMGVHNGAQNVETIMGGVLWIITILSCFVISCIAVANATFVAILVAEDLSVKQCCTRLIDLIRQQPRYVFTYIAIFCLVDFALQSSMAVLMFLHYTIYLFKGNVREMVTGVMYCVESVLNSPMYALVFAASTVGTMGLYRQLTYRVEGQDIIERLGQLETPPQTP